MISESSEQHPDAACGLNALRLVWRAWKLVPRERRILSDSLGKVAAEFEKFRNHGVTLLLIESSPFEYRRYGYFSKHFSQIVWRSSGTDGL
jgi:hypothetical protein